MTQMQSDFDKWGLWITVHFHVYYKKNLFSDGV